MLHLAWLIKACHGIGELFGDAQADRVVGGTQLVARRVAEQLKDEIKLNQPVRRIRWNPKGAVVHSDGIAVQARHVIVCIPPNLAGAIEYVPPLPTNRVQVTQRWPQGLVIKVSIVYSAPFWRDDGLNGTSYDHISVMGETADSSNPESVPSRHPHRFRLFRQCAQGGAAACRGTQADPVGRDRQALRPKGAGARELSRSRTGPKRNGRAAASPASLRPAQQRSSAAPCAIRSGPIHWAGTETSTDWPSFIDGAIRSGEREAEAVRKAS